MARGVNKVILVGNVGGDPDVRYLPNGNAVTNITIATSETWKDKQTGQKQERTEWNRAVLFNRLGEIAGEYLSKGSKVYIEGSLRTRKWQAQDGSDRYTTEIVASELQMLDNRNAQQGTNQRPAQQNNQQSASRTSNGTKPSLSTQGPPPDDFDDDVPFFNPYKYLEYLV